MIKRTIAAIGLCAAVVGCHTGRNYPSPSEPRYAAAPRADSLRRSDTLRIVSFNIAFGRNIDGAIELFRTESALQRPDIVLLQEMNVESTRRIADALGMGFVYYPAIYHVRAEREFGNAVLSAWPIIDDAKLILPHVSRYATTQRTATAATIRVGADTIRVYSTHLGTFLDITNAKRRDQLSAILTNAAPFSRVVIGGDLNSAGVGTVARDAGYAWPTERGARTTRGGRWDHIFLKGLATPDSSGAGTITEVHGVSDHRPVWVRITLPRAERGRP